MWMMAPHVNERILEDELVCRELFPSECSVSAETFLPRTFSSKNAKMPVESYVEASHGGVFWL
jgi:hypothetical protein